MNGWRAFLLVALVAGVFLRTVNVSDMEYKEDEQYHYSKSQTIGSVEPWPWVGIPSGVYLVNPGMSVWVFAALAKATGAHTPTELERSLEWLSLLGICLLLPLALRFLPEKEPREAWLWAMALALVNPFEILYQRKLWPEPFFPFFTTLFLLAWFRRDRRAGAFFWGLLGACLGQIHMSGFFFAFGVAAFTLLRRRKGTRWGAWFAGSCAGAWPLVPWALYMHGHPVTGNVTTGWSEILQFKFWSFWLTDALGLHLGNPLGLLRGNSNWAQISDFVRYPLLGGSATYVVGLAHATALAAALGIFGAAIFALFKDARRPGPRSAGKEGTAAYRFVGAIFGRTHTDTGLLLAASLIGFGVTLTLTGVNIRRYYMMVSFPLELVTLAWLALSVLPPKAARAALGLLWASQLVMSAGFVDYVHVNQGATQGDYGEAYHVVVEKRPELAFPQRNW